MATKGRQRIVECVYCGEARAPSRDHIPPAGLFSKPRPADLITVPSCSECNAGASLDDEYFRLAITAGMDPTKLPGEFDVSIEAIRKLGRREKLGLAKTVLSGFKRESLYTPAGVYVGEKGALTVDRARVQRVVVRIVRGLFFHHFRKRLPASATVSVVSDWFTPVLPDEEVRACVESVLCLLSVAKPVVIGSGVFGYRWRTIEGEPYGSVWWLSFYDHRRFLCWTTQSDDTAPHTPDGHRDSNGATSTTDGPRNPAGESHDGGTRNQPHVPGL
ncbi:MAG TPA: hypothetical protein VMP68_32885 [Candidatus Eisenbacteria bacterium]|nr:hypothetical protein [Candidatus Eisenbacteria bacterium]